ncbi:MAG TPA: Imm26 family immunity protein [Micromonosporaceae bacterium]|nr:Imm26 family immunity protein [Micromonosporaceae bacterium]
MAWRTWLAWALVPVGITAVVVGLYLWFTGRSTFWSLVFGWPGGMAFAWLAAKLRGLDTGATKRVMKWNFLAIFVVMFIKPTEVIPAAKWMHDVSEQPGIFAAARGGIREGTVFAVPLKTGRYALGVVTRHGPSAVTVGYFFGPPLDTFPALPKRLEPAEAVLVARFGDLPLVSEAWEVLGTLPEWDRSAWPSASFLRHADSPGRSDVVVYDDNDPAVVVDERPATLDDMLLPSDDLRGYVSLREELSEILSHRVQPVER